MTGTGLRRERWHGYLFIAPAYLFLAAIILVPLGQAIWTSVLRVRGLTTRFVGLENYGRVLADDAFWNALRVSLLFTSACVLLHMVLGFGLALVVNETRRLRGLLRLLFLVPWMIAPAIGATIWLWLLDPQFGVVNYVLTALGGTAQVWLGEPGLALASVSAVDVWRGLPFVMLLLMAGGVGGPPGEKKAPPPGRARARGGVP